MTTLNITLEWFLNPDHLPMIAGIQTGAYRAAGLAVNLKEPSDHYDGFAGLFDGSTDIHTNEPLHLFEHFRPDLRSLGTFFETDGGVLMRQSSMSKLRNGGKIKICTPAAEPETNRIGFEILKRYADKNGFALAFADVEFVAMGFHHLENLQNHPEIDGAWLCFYNFEGVEAEHLGFEHTFIDQHQSPFANFSALEFITSQQVISEKRQALHDFVRISSEMTAMCRQNPEKAKQIYYAYTQTQPDALTDAIIENTLTRLIEPVCADAERWKNLRAMLTEIGLFDLTDEQYQGLWQ